MIKSCSTGLKQAATNFVQTLTHVLLIDRLLARIEAVIGRAARQRERRLTGIIQGDIFRQK